jgi:hypothetical protein
MSWNKIWDRVEVVNGIRKRARDGLDLCPKVVRVEASGLYQAAFRYVGSWRKALRAAGVRDPYLRRRPWNRGAVLDEIRKRFRMGLPISPKMVQDDDPSLWNAGNRLFGRWSRALEEAGFDPFQVYERPERIAR